MASPRKPNLFDLAKARRAAPDDAAAFRQLAKAAKDYLTDAGITKADLAGMFTKPDDMISYAVAHQIAGNAGVDPKKFESPGQLVDWARQQAAGGAKTPPKGGNAAQAAAADKIAPPQKPAAATAPASKPATQGQPQKPAAPAKPAQASKEGGAKAGGEKLPNDERIKSILITGGQDKAAVDKMTGDQLRAAYRAMTALEKEAPLSSDVDPDPAKRPPATEAELGEVPAEPIKVPAKGKGKGGGQKGGTKPKTQAAKQDSTNVPPPADDDGPDVADTEVDMSGQQPNIDATQKPTDKPKGGKSGWFGMGEMSMGERAGSWSEWAGNPSKRLPERMGPGGFFYTPSTLDAAQMGVSYLARRPIPATIAGYTAYQFSKPLWSSGDEKQKEQSGPGVPPPMGNANQYWDDYRPILREPPAQPMQPGRGDIMGPKQGIDWWDSQPEINARPQRAPADTNQTSVDIIRQLRGMA